MLTGVSWLRTNLQGQQKKAANLAVRNKVGREDGQYYCL
jgi:hypothetical protein